MNSSSACDRRGQQCAAPAVDECKHSAAGTLHPHRIAPIHHNNWPARVLVQNAHFREEIWTPHNTSFFGPTQVYTPKGISIDSAVFAQLTVVPTQTQAHHAHKPRCVRHL